MRITYKGTLLEQLLILETLRPISYIDLEPSEFDELLSEAERRGLVKDSRKDWFVLNCSEITFYLISE